MSSFTALDTIELASALASLILAVVAIWLSMAFFMKSSDSEKNIEVAVNKVGEATTTLSRLSMRLISRLTSAIIGQSPAEPSMSELIKEANNAGLLARPEEGGRATMAVIEQWRVDNLIAALYYCGISNLTLQLQLPPTIGETTATGVANLVDQTHTDFNTLNQWISAADNSEAKIDASPVKHLYEQIHAAATDIRSVRDFYVMLERTNSQPSQTSTNQP